MNFKLKTKPMTEEDVKAVVPEDRMMYVFDEDSINPVRIMDWSITAYDRVVFKCMVIAPAYDYVNSFPHRMIAKTYKDAVANRRAIIASKIEKFKDKVAEIRVEIEDLEGIDIPDEEPHRRKEGESNIAYC